MGGGGGRKPDVNERPCALRTTLRFSACAYLAIAALVGGCLTVTFRTEVNPFVVVVSDDVFVDEGVALSTLLLIVAGGALVAGLITVGAPAGRTAYVLCGAWSLGLALAVIFFAPDPTSGSLSGAVDRHAGATFFISLPCAGCKLSRDLRSVRGAAGLTAATFGACRFRCRFRGFPALVRSPTSTLRGSPSGALSPLTWRCSSCSAHR